MKFPQLYQQSTVGNIKCWRIETKGAEIITTFGLQGGKEQVARDIIKVGKNIGKANETTPEHQAELEAKATWEKKIKKGYVQELGRAKAGEDNTAEGSWLPMLAHKFSEQGHKIAYPAYVQPKLDGHRCVTDEDSNLWSRTRKPIGGADHISAAIKTLFSGAPWVALLDGELYNHEYRAKFEELTHFIRQPQTIPGAEVVQYHIYDMQHPDEHGNDMTFAQRYKWLKGSIPAKHPHLKLVETIKVENEDELMEAFEHYVAQGYEGAIVRNAAALYEHKRSYNLQKIKTFDDAEFNIVGIEEGRGKLMGHAGKFICETKDGTKFGAKAKGEMGKLKEYFDNHSLWQGKKLTVQYQGVTNKNGVPRFPIGLRIRED